MSMNAHTWGSYCWAADRILELSRKRGNWTSHGGSAMDKDKTPSEPRLDEDLAVEDESAEKVIGGHSLSHKTSPAHTHSHTSHPDHFNI